MTKEFIQEYFNADFKGIDSLLNEVLVPIFGNYEEGWTEITSDLPSKEKAAQANIKRIKHAATLWAAGRTIRVFDVTLFDNCHIHTSRKNIQTLIRQYVGHFQGALIAFHYENPTNRSWRLSYLEKQDSNANSTSAKRYTYLCGKDYPCRTIAERFAILAGQDKTDMNLEAAFSVEALSDEFFTGYRIIYRDFCDYLTLNRHNADLFGEEFATCDEKFIRDYVKKMMGRITFLHFLQRKGWLGQPRNIKGWGKGDLNFMHNLFDKASDEQKDNFLDDVLEPIFFECLNEKREDDFFDTRVSGIRLVKIPYLNGGLFEKDKIDEPRSKFPAEKFRRLFDFFGQYNFTIDESDPLDQEVGVDPEMLGKIFENLLEDNKDKGAFYTPKEIVQYMCREALVAYLVDEARAKSEVNKQRQENFEDAIRALVADPDLTIQRMKRYGDTQLKDLRQSLMDVKICDPAIGSGAFPMGLLNILFSCRMALNDALGEGVPRALLKKDIIRNNIYGVDIEKGAIDIARLRFWLSIVVDLEEPEPLPNFDYKFMQGNSLLEQYKGVDLSTLIQRKSKQNEAMQISMFEDQLDVLRLQLRKYLDEYFVTTDHDVKNRLRKDIKENVKQQLQEQHICVDFPEEYDISANTDFFLWHTWFADVFNRLGKQGFDIVIGNPPYLKEGRISKVFFDPYKNSPYYMGKMDIWYIFACFGIDLLQEHGHLCYIATNNWTTNYGASILRNKIIRETRICQIIDFGALMMFESASIQTMIMLLQKDSHTDDYSFDYRKSTQKATNKDAINILKKESDNAEYIEPIIRRNNYIDTLLTFSNNDYILNQIQFGAERIFLEENELTNGIHPHFDFVNKKLAENYNLNVGEGIFGLTYNELELLELTEEEKKLIKPYYNSSNNVERYFVGKTDLSIIYTPSSYKDPHSMDNYPHLKSHLDKYVNVITSDNKPYGLHRARVEDFFLGEKVVALRKCAEKPLFAYACGDNYMSATFYVIKTKRLNLKYLTGVLNSKIIEFWLRNKGKMQGDIFQLDKEPLMRIPIALPTNDVQCLIAKLVDVIILLKQSKQQVNPYVPNEFIAQKFEKMINGCVYEVYFEDEVKQYCGDSIISIIQKQISDTITIQNINELCTSIESTGIIDTIDSFSISNSDILRTISLS